MKVLDQPATTGAYFETVVRHEVPTPAAREELKAGEFTAKRHRRAMRRLPCMTQVEAAGAATDGPLPFPLTVAAWNLERCYFPQDSARLLAGTEAGIMLLSELDAGMARTGQRHTTRDLADWLDVPYAYAVEFLELSLGAANERRFCTGESNEWGFHGNAILSRAALRSPFLVRLDDHGHWFSADGDQSRIGGRCAVGAAVATEAGPLLAASVHLESNADGAYRARQMALLLQCLETMAPDMPVIVGGDLNTGVGAEGALEGEGLFAIARDRSFACHGGAPGQTTVRPSRISTPEYPYRLDWILTRGLTVTETRLHPALGPKGEALTDHEMVTVEIEGFSAATL